MKKLTVDKIHELEQKRFARKRIGIEIDGETYFVKIDTKFRQSKIDELIQTVLRDMEESEKEGIEANPMIVSNLGILQMFTDLEFPENIAKKMSTFIALVDLGVVEKVFEHFEEKEFEQLTNQIVGMKNRMPEMMEQFKKYSEELAEIDEKVNEAIKE